MKTFRRCTAGLFLVTAVLALLLPVYLNAVAAQESVAFPADPGGFNGMIITYSISGISANPPVDTNDFTTSREFNFTVTGNTVTVSGSFQMLKPASGVYAQATAEVDIGDQTQSVSFNNTGTTGNWNQPFTVSVAAPSLAQTGSISLGESGDYANGESRGLVVDGYLTPPTIVVDHITVASPYDSVAAGDNPFTITATVFATGNTQVPDGTTVAFSLTDKEGGTLAGAYIDPDTAYTVNSAVSVTFYPPDSSYWNDALHSNYAGVNSITITASAGGKQGGYEILIENPTQTNTPSATSNPNHSSPCIIFTATYGSPLAAQVVFMRSVRDDMIGASPTGKTLVVAWNDFYYSWSPPVAHAIAGSEGLKDTFKVLLTPLLGSMYIVAATYHGIAWLNPDIAAVVAFLTAAVFSIGIYIIIPLLATKYGIKLIRKRARHSPTESAATFTG